MTFHQTLLITAGVFMAVLATSLPAQRTIFVGPGIGIGNGTETSPYPTIAAGVKAAAPLDTIMVMPGTYVETMPPFGKQLKIIGVGGPAMTKIVGDPENPGPVFHFTAAEADSLLEGLSISGGTGHMDPASETLIGGAIFCDDVIPRVRFCRIEDNTADIGGGIGYIGRGPEVLSTIIANNVATRSGGGVGGIGGSNDAAVFVNCIVHNNLSPLGAGVAVDGADVALRNTTIIENVASAAGGGLYATGAGRTHLVTNVILYGNVPQEIVLAGGASPIVEHSDVMGGWPGRGNFDANPLFANASLLDFRILPSSPCIDAGTSWVGQQAVDFEGEPRIFGPAVDVGADEFNGLFLPLTAEGNAGGDVLLVNGSAGLQARRVDVPMGEPFMITANPAPGMTTGDFVLFQMDGVATYDTATPLPHRLGTMAITTGGIEERHVVLGSRGVSLSDAVPAPWSGIVTPSDAGPLQMTVQGLLTERGSVRVTNAVLINIQ